VLKIAPAAPFSGLLFHDLFSIGPFSPKIPPAAPFNVYFLLLYLSKRAPKRKLPGAREDLNPALSVVIIYYCIIVIVVLIEYSTLMCRAGLRSSWALGSLLFGAHWTSILAKNKR
jgi:hypothetical protein